MATTTISEWRAAADPEELREYDRFGPWIDRITDLVDLPRRFRPWWPELARAVHLLKVPRDYDRAQIRPGMDLYRLVIAVFDDRLCVLDAGAADVVRSDIPRHDVVATVLRSELLRGRWTLLLADGNSFDIEFNTVSQPVVAEVDRYLLAAPATDGRVRVPVPALRPSEHLFRSLLATLNAATDDPLVPVHLEDAGRPCRTGQGRRRRSAGAMVLASGEDLVLVDRGRTTQPLFRRANYAVAITRVPLRLVTSFTVQPAGPASPPAFSHLMLTCGRRAVTLPCLDPPDAVAAVLASHGIPRTPASPDPG